MRARMIVGGIIATLVLAGSAVAFGDGGDRRVPASPVGSEAQALPKSLAKAQRTVARVTHDRVRCRTLRCINKALSQLAKAFNTLNQCLSYINIARYNGYMYSTDGGANEFVTTALDEAEPGTPATRAVIFTC